MEGIRKAAWDAFLSPILEERGHVMDMLDEIASTSSHASELADVQERLAALPSVSRRDIHAAAHEALRILRDEVASLQASPHPMEAGTGRGQRGTLRLARLFGQRRRAWRKSNLFTPTRHRPLMGFEVMNAAFDSILARDPRTIAFGEDVGKLGDVNQGFKGMQEKYGAMRVTDTGIREATILGQAIGMAMRGLRPIAEIQYLDYLLYALQIMSDDLATLHWRTVGGQSAPVIVRTRGHRLEGIWHSGSLMSGIINLVRGMNVLVPRDMTRAAGFYNTLLEIRRTRHHRRSAERLPRQRAPARQPERDDRPARRPRNHPRGT